MSKVMTAQQNSDSSFLSSCKDYYEMTKPNVVLLLLLTALVGMCLASDTWISWQVFIAGLTGIGSWFFAKPFLTSDFTYVRIPPFEKFELATAALFDLGVFLAVVGAVMLSLESFSRLARRAHVIDSEHPMDIDPSRDDMPQNAVVKGEV